MPAVFKRRRRCPQCATPVKAVYRNDLGVMFQCPGCTQTFWTHHPNNPKSGDDQ